MKTRLGRQASPIIQFAMVSISLLYNICPCACTTPFKPAEVQSRIPFARDNNLHRYVAAKQHLPHTDYASPKEFSGEAMALTAIAVVTHLLPNFILLCPYLYSQPAFQPPSSHCKSKRARRSMSQFKSNKLHVRIRIARSRAFPLCPTRSCNRSLRSGPSMAWRWTSFEDCKRRPK